MVKWGYDMVRGGYDVGRSEQQNNVNDLEFWLESCANKNRNPKIRLCKIHLNFYFVQS